MPNPYMKACTEIYLSVYLFATSEMSLEDRLKKAYFKHLLLLEQNDFPEGIRNRWLKVFLCLNAYEHGLNSFTKQECLEMIGDIIDINDFLQAEHYF